MFSLQSEHCAATEAEKSYTVTLELKYQGITFCFSPEWPEHINNIDIDADAGCFDTTPSNGEFHLDWSQKFITMTSGRYGDGCGGCLEITVPSTPELLQSLHSALQTWKNLML